MSAFVYVHVFKRMYALVRLYVCACVHVPVCVHVCICLSVLSVCARVNVCTCTNAYTCARVCVCVWSPCVCYSGEEHRVAAGQWRRAPPSLCQRLPGCGKVRVSPGLLPENSGAAR